MARTRKIVLFLNTGRNPHVGWRRMAVDLGRTLAAEGLASFRFDNAGVGESPARADEGTALLFSPEAIQDVRAACDLVAAHGYDDITVFGICSGAYLGLIAAVEEPRIRQLLLVNLPRFAWGRHESIEAAIRFANRPRAHTVARALSRDTLRRIVTGQLDPRPALRFKLGAVGRRLAFKIAPVVRGLSPAWETYRLARDRLETLAARKVALILGYSADDGGGAELELLFGRDGRRLPGRAQTRVDTISGVDHNLSQQTADAWLLRHLRALSGRVG